MTIEIQQPEIEALILQRMEIGGFHDVEEVLLHALRSAPLPTTSSKAVASGTGADIIAAMQAMPCKDIDIGTSRPHLLVGDVELRENLAQFLLDSPLHGSGLESERIRDFPRPVEL
jgi:hypothetical protein